MIAARFAKLCRVGLGVAVVATATALAWAAQAPGLSTYEGDCSSCHANDRVLPDSHVQTPGLQWQDCVDCHDPTDESLTLRGRLPLAHAHGLQGMACDACHEDGVDSAPEGDDACVKCHGSLEELPTRPSGGRPNPHDSHYQGLDCTYCHHAHVPSDDFCLECHDFGYRVP